MPRMMPFRDQSYSVANTYAGVEEPKDGPALYYESERNPDTGDHYVLIVDRYGIQIDWFSDNNDDEPVPIFIAANYHMCVFIADHLPTIITPAMLAKLGFVTYGDNGHEVPLDDVFNEYEMLKPAGSLPLVETEPAPRDQIDLERIHQLERSCRILKDALAPFRSAYMSTYELLEPIENKGDVGIWSNKQDGDDGFRLTVQDLRDAYSAFDEIKEERSPDPRQATIVYGLNRLWVNNYERCLVRIVGLPDRCNEYTVDVNISPSGKARASVSPYKPLYPSVPNV